MSLMLAKKFMAHGFPVIPVPYGTKAPVIKDWPNVMVTPENVAQYFTDQPQNIAVILGKEKSMLVDLDIDHPQARHFANWYAPKTGYVYGRASNPGSHWLYTSLDEAGTAKFDHPELGMLLELRGKGCASILPGSGHPSGEKYTAETEQQPAAIAYKEIYKAAALVAACTLMTLRWPAKGARQNAALAFAGMLCKAGYTAEQVCSAVYYTAEYANDEEATKRRSAADDTVKKFQQGILVAGISALESCMSEADTNCLKKWLAVSTKSEVEEMVAELNEKHAFIIVGGSQRILTFKKDVVNGDKTISFMKLDAFKGFYKKDKVCVGYDKNGPIIKSIADVWLSHEMRRTYEDMVFEPGRTLPPAVFNYWQGYGVEPGPDETKCEKFLAHLHQIICSGNEEHFLWLVAWLAQMVQEPAKKPGTAIVLIGPQGAGKTCIGEYIGQIFKPHYLKINNSRHLLGNFNAHQDGIIFAMCEEAFLAGDKNAQGVLKDMVTSESMMIERKGVDPVKSKNCLHLFITSNNPWVVSASTDDRRFFVLEVSGAVANDRKYFSELMKEQAGNGPAALLAFLQNYDYSGTELHKPPHTEALVMQKIETLEPIAKVLYKFLTQGHLHPKSKVWPEWIETEQFCDLCFAGTKKVGVADKGLQTKFGMSLTKYLGSLKKEKKTLPEINPDTGVPYDIAVGGSKTQQMVYILPSLEECRKRFTQLTGIPFKEQ